MSDSQKFIARNRAPRVQIEYDVELYGAEKTVQLPFVMGVMSDLSGKSHVAQPAVADRKFLEIDVDSFDDRMKAMAPRVAFSVPNTLTGEGNLSVDLTFEAMSDFEPGAIAARIEPLRGLLEARTQLSNLMAYMDGKAGAEKLIETILSEPALLSALGGTGSDSAETAAALDSLRALMPAEAPTQADATADVLAGLASKAPEDAPANDTTGDILSGLAAQAPETGPERDASADVLSGLAAQAPDDSPTPDASAGVLSGLAAQAPEPGSERDASADVLSGLADQAPDDSPTPDASADVLSGLAAQAPETGPERDASADVLSGLAEQAPSDPTPPETNDNVLSALAATDPDAAPAADPTSDILSGIADAATDEPAEEDSVGDVLSGLSIPAPEPEEAVDATSGILSGLATESQVDTADADATEDALSALAAAMPEPEAPKDDTSDILSELATDTPATEAVDAAGDVLAGLSTAAPPEPEAEDDGLDDILGGLSDGQPEAVAEPDVSGAALESLAAAEVPEAEDGDDLDDILGGLDAAPEPEVEDDGLDDILGGLSDAQPEAVAEPDVSGAALESLAAAEVPEVEAGGDLDDILGGLDAAPEPQAEDDGLDDILGGLSDGQPEAVAEPDVAGAALESLAAVEVPEAEAEDDGLDDILGGLSDGQPEAVAEPDAAGAALESLAAAEVPEAEAGDDLDDILGGLDAAPEPEVEDDGLDDILGGLSDGQPEAVAEPDVSGAALESLAAVEVPEVEAGDDLDDILGGLDAAPEPQAEDDGLDDILGGLETAAEEEVGGSDLDDLLGDLEPSGGSGAGDAPAAAIATETATENLGVDDLLGDLGATEEGVAEVAPEGSAGVDDLGLDDLLGGLETTEAAAAAEEPPVAAELDALDLDDLLGDLEAPEPAEAVAVEAEPVQDDGLDLDDLLGALDDPATPDTGGGSELDDLLGGLDETGTSAGSGAAGATLSEPEFAFGTMAGAGIAAERLERRRFRIALFGDFTGRSARGALETGEALAARAPVLLDPDTVEDIIEGFAGDLVLPVGKDGAGVQVPITGLDDLHPDEIYEKVELFSELNGLRGQLTSGASSANAQARLKDWAEAHDMPLAPTHSRSAATSVPADRKLSDFQQLIGDHQGALTQTSPIEEMIARIIGPHVRRAPDMDAVKLVDEAISSAMRLILHHPDLQALESQWRSLDLLARSIEADDTLEVMLYDISAEEIAADLAASEDLSQSGFAKLLTGPPMDEETGRGAYSALIGLYAFEETPPHAQILGRIARVAAHVDAPFVTSISPGFMETSKEDRHPLVAEAWDTLRAMPEAAYLGLAAPRFMLRRPYGAKTEPIYEFEFEEFTMAEGLKGLLWANPVVLITILLAQSFRKNGPALDLGSVMSLGEIPYHYVNDRFGDQVQLPCTERNLTLGRVEEVMARGIMPVIWVKGRDEIRLASFNAMGGAPLRGPWSGLPPVEKSPPKPVNPQKTDDTVTQTTDMMDELDDLLSGFDTDTDTASETDLASGGDGDIDAELAALLEDL